MRQEDQEQHDVHHDAIDREDRALEQAPAALELGLKRVGATHECR
jgi:hypothetical protein